MIHPPDTGIAPVRDGQSARARSACVLPDSPLAAASAGLDACVHCGFCLQACPTYVNLEDENDSPRGRIVLMRRLLDGELALDDHDAATHIDRCLGCRACETACPSGVPYGELLEATRATMASVRRLPLVARMVLGVFSRKSLLKPALLFARLFRATGLPGVLARVLLGASRFHWPCSRPPRRREVACARHGAVRPPRLRLPHRRPPHRRPWATRAARSHCLKAA